MTTLDMQQIQPPGYFTVNTAAIFSLGAVISYKAPASHFTYRPELVFDRVGCSFHYTLTLGVFPSSVTHLRFCRLKLNLSNFSLLGGF